MQAPKERGIYKALYGRAMGRRPQGRPRLRWIDNVRQDATSLGVRDWQAPAKDRGQWKAVVEAAVKLQTEPTEMMTPGNVLVMPSSLAFIHPLLDVGLSSDLPRLPILSRTAPIVPENGSYVVDPSLL